MQSFSTCLVVRADKFHAFQHYYISKAERYAQIMLGERLMAVQLRCSIPIPKRSIQGRTYFSFGRSFVMKATAQDPERQDVQNAIFVKVHQSGDARLQRYLGRG